jgi:hypothetical protein
MREIFLRSIIVASMLFATVALNAAELNKKPDNRDLRTLTGDGDTGQKTCPDNTFLCYTSCCTNSEECCTTTKGCVAVGSCAPSSPQSIKQFDKLQR